MLETLGVPVFGFGTDEFPAFYRRSTGLAVDQRYDSIAELACAVRVHLSLGFDTGVLIANPIPVADEMPTELYDRAIETALSDAEGNSIRGRATACACSPAGKASEQIWRCCATMQKSPRRLRSRGCEGTTADIWWRRRRGRETPNLGSSCCWAAW